ncbi:MAG TPA: hypothetical protein VJY15_21635 [Candidatus Acidoferrum sp.]|nr:hypothetical protein [Candidatus Acidoferrum sp.]
MKKKSKAKVPKKRGRRPPVKIRIEVVRGTERTFEAVELAIKEKLAAYPTDLFRNNQTVIIQIQEEGGHNGPGTKAT